MREHRFRLLCIILVVSSLVLGACAAPSPLPGRDGFSPARLDALTRAIRAEVDAKRMPGVVMIAVRDGRTVYKQVMGVRDPRTGEPMTEDAIFRLYSMTKPVISLAALILVEEGKLAVGAPVSLYVPELKELRLALDKTDASGKVETAKALRQPTIHDLLRHTSGLTSESGTTPASREYQRAGLAADKVDGAKAFVEKLAAMPLAIEPGSRWEYGMSTDLLGVVVERVSGQPLDVFLREKIFGPLGMVDTGFWVEAPKQGRIAEPFELHPANQQPIKLLDIRKRPAFLSGGAGLVSTAGDYLRFARMMLSGGELDGVRIVSRKTIEYMTSDHLGGVPAIDWIPGYAFGLGVAVRPHNGLATVHGSAGDYWWLGYGGTTFWVDPKERLVAVFLCQAPGYQLRNTRVFRNMLYAAME